MNQLDRIESLLIEARRDNSVIAEALSLLFIAGHPAQDDIVHRVREQLREMNQRPPLEAPSR